MYKLIFFILHANVQSFISGKHNANDGAKEKAGINSHWTAPINGRLMYLI